MIKIIAGFVLCIVLLFTTGCTSTVKVPVQTNHNVTQEILLQKCTADTPIPVNSFVDKDGVTTYNGREVLRILIQWQTVYDECASTHDALVDTIRKIKDTENLKIRIKE